MNKKVKKIITVAALTGGAMYAFNKFIDYTASYRGLTLDDDENKYAPTFITGDYNSIYQEAILSKLKVGYIYVIRDFRSIYLDRDGRICGLDYMPS